MCTYDPPPAEKLWCMTPPLPPSLQILYHFHHQINAKWQQDNLLKPVSSSVQHVSTAAVWRTYFSLRSASINHLTFHNKLIYSGTTLGRLLCNDLRMAGVKMQPVTVRKTMIFITMTLPDWHHTVQNKQTISSSASLHSCFGTWIISPT